MIAYLESLNNTPEHPNPNSPPLMKGRSNVFQLSPSFGRVQNLVTIQMILPPPQSNLHPSAWKEILSKVTLRDVILNIGIHNSSLPVDAWIVQSHQSDVFRNIYVSLRVNEDSLRVLERLNYKVAVFPKSQYYAYFRKACGGCASTDEWLPPTLMLDYERTRPTHRRHNRGPPINNNRRLYCDNFTRYPYWKVDSV